MTTQWVILGLLVAGLAVAWWWRRPDDLEQARQRERALKAMEKWTR